MLRDKIRAESDARRARYAEFARTWQRATEAGLAAGRAVVPAPMHIRGYAPIADGVCGFAWIVVHPATCSFARWCAKERSGRREYGGGMCVYWVGEFNQSMTRKEAYAHEFARVLREAGIDAHARSRMD